MSTRRGCACVGAGVRGLLREHSYARDCRAAGWCLDLVGQAEPRGVGAEQAALVAAATSGSHKFFLGTDSAPHARSTKEAACGCAGCYTAHAALELYAEAFEAAGALDRLEAFASFNGPDFYRLPRNSTTATLEKQPWVVPEAFAFVGGDPLVPLCAGESLGWRLVG